MCVCVCVCVCSDQSTSPLFDGPLGHGLNKGRLGGPIHTTRPEVTVTGDYTKGHLVDPICYASTHRRLTIF